MATCALDGLDRIVAAPGQTVFTFTFDADLITDADVLLWFEDVSAGTPGAEAAQGGGAGQFSVDRVAKTCTLVTPAEVNDVITMIRRQSSPVRKTTFTNPSDFIPSVVNNEFDHFLHGLEDLGRDRCLAIRMDYGVDPSSLNLELPAPVLNAPIGWVSTTQIGNLPPIVGGGGTLNKIPLWTPDGFTLGDSAMTQSAGNVVASGTFSSTDLIITSDGSSVAPAVKWASPADPDGNTGFYIPASGNLGITGDGVSLVVFRQGNIQFKVDIRAETDVVIIGDLFVNSGSITSPSGAISFGNENLSTTGTLASGVLTVTGTVTAQLDGGAASTITSLFENTGSGDSISELEIKSFNSDWKFRARSSVAVPSLELRDVTTGNTIMTIETGSPSGCIVIQGSGNVNIGAGDLVLSNELFANGGVIRSNTGAISFLDENLSTTGTLASGALTVTGNITLTGELTGSITIAGNLAVNGGNITSSSGAIAFANENLSTTGTLASGNLNVTGLIKATSPTVAAITVYRADKTIGQGASFLFNMNDSIDSEVGYAEIFGSIGVNTTTLISGNITFKVKTAGANTNILTLIGATKLATFSDDVTLNAGDLEVTLGQAGFGTIPGEQFHYSGLIAGAKALFIKDIETSTEAVVEIRQTHTGGAVPCLELDQDDASEAFIDFVGSEKGVIDEGTSSLESVTIAVNGTLRRLAVYAV